MCFLDAGAPPRTENYPIFDPESVYKWIKKGNPKLNVLARLKRFGKSVFLQMVRRFLEGKEELFNGIEIATR